MTFFSGYTMAMTQSAITLDGKPLFKVPAGWDQFKDLLPDADLLKKIVDDCERATNMWLLPSEDRTEAGRLFHVVRNNGGVFKDFVNADGLTKLAIAAGPLELTGDGGKCYLY